MYIPTFGDVVAAHERIRPYIHRTPVLTSSFLNGLAGAELFFKCENFQKAAAFKARGASNAVFGLTDAQAAKGVATHSSGNHGLCLSYAAGRRGIPCTVVMPRTAPQAKKDAVKGYGGRVVECEPSTSSREAVFAEVVAETGAEFVHPYNDPRVIAGQATCSRELNEQVEGLDAVVAPIGGGGMVSSMADYARFVQMLLNRGELNGKRILARKTVDLMTANHIGEAAGIKPWVYYFPGGGYGFGLGVAVRTEAGVSHWAGSVGEYEWSGGSGTYFLVDPKEDMFAILMIQSPSQRGRIQSALKSLIYGALK